MILKCNNTDCDNHNINTTKSIVNLVVRDGEVEYCDKNKAQYICDECKKPLVEVKDKKHQGFGAFHCAFSGKTSDEKIAILKKREREHYKRDKNAHEYKKYKDNEGIQ